MARDLSVEGESFHGCRHQAGAAPRKEDEKEVPRVEAAGEGEGGRSRLETPLVRHRMAGANEATSGRKTLPAVVRRRHDERLVDPFPERRMRRAGHRHGPLADGQESHPRRDEDELPLRRGEDGPDAKGVAAPSESGADEPARIDGRDSGTEELGEEISRLQSARSLPDGRGCCRPRGDRPWTGIYGSVACGRGLILRSSIIPSAEGGAPPE